MDAADPLWPMFPLFRAWPSPHAARPPRRPRRSATSACSTSPCGPAWKRLAVAAVVFAAAGSDAQRRWVYEQLRPHAGTHVVVGGCASYHAAVDHHLGALAASLGDTAAAEAHFRAALAMHERLGAAGWARLSEQALAGLLAAAPRPATNELRLVDGMRLISFGGRQVRLPDSKGLGDLAALIGARGADVHVLTLVGHHLARMGADPVLDRAGQGGVQGAAGRPGRRDRGRRRRGERRASRGAALRT